MNMFLSSTHCFWLKYKSSVYNIVFLSEQKVALSESGNKYAQIKHSLRTKIV